MKDQRRQIYPREMPVNVQRTPERVTPAALMPGLVSSEDIVIDVTTDNRLVLHADLRGELNDNVDPLEHNEALQEERRAGSYHRELELPRGRVGGRYGNWQRLIR